MREESFTIPFDILVRRVVPAPGRGTPYEHTCSKEVFDSVAFAIEDLAGGTFTGEEIRAAVGCDAPFTQVMVALAFLKERGIIVPANRRRSVCNGSGFMFEEAMIEWHGLREGSPGSLGATQREEA